MQPVPAAYNSRGGWTHLPGTSGSGSQWPPGSRLTVPICINPPPASPPFSLSAHLPALLGPLCRCFPVFSTVPGHVECLPGRFGANRLAHQIGGTTKATNGSPAPILLSTDTNPYLCERRALPPLSKACPPPPPPPYFHRMSPSPPPPPPPVQSRWRFLGAP